MALAVVRVRVPLWAPMPKKSVAKYKFLRNLQKDPKAWMEYLEYEKRMRGPPPAQKPYPIPYRQIAEQILSDPDFDPGAVFLDVMEEWVRGKFGDAQKTPIVKKYFKKHGI